MTRRSVVVALTTAFVLAAGLTVAWQQWPPLLRYREGRAIAAGRTIVRRYLAGKDSLELAAHRLADVLRQWDDLAFRNADAPAPTAGSMVIESLGITPPDVAPNDPRVEELFLNAMRLSVPAVASEEFRAQAVAQLDSIILARGHRIVR